jgi:hypothetical protein
MTNEELESTWVEQQMSKIIAQGNLEIENIIWNNQTLKNDN